MASLNPTPTGKSLMLSNVDTKGDLLVGSANDTVARLPVGADGEVLTADSAEATGLKWAAGGGGGGALDDLSDVIITSPTQGDVLVRDASSYKNLASQSPATIPSFLAQNFNGDLFFSGTLNTFTAGGGTQASSGTGVDNNGTNWISTARGQMPTTSHGTTVNSEAEVVGNGVYGGRYGEQTVIHNSISYMNLAIQTLATATDDYYLMFGYSGRGVYSGGSEGAHEIVFEYNRSLNTNWRAKTRSSSVSTVTDTGIAVTTGWTHLSILLESASSCKFYINGTLVATHTTNIPSTSQLIRLRFYIRKTAGSLNRFFCAQSQTCRIHA